MQESNELTPRQALQKAIDNELNKKPYIILHHFADSDDNTDNTDNPAFPIIEFLKEKIKEAEDIKDYWEINYLKSNMSQYYRQQSINRIYAFKEVLEFIEETFKPE